MMGIRRVFWWYENEGKYDWWEYGLVRKKCLGKHYLYTTHVLHLTTVELQPALQ